MAGPSSSLARQSLDRAAIVEAALALLQDEGLDQLSTRRLARALGVSGPSLYWHFRNMAELRSHMAFALLSAARAEHRPSDDWRVWLAEGARAIRRAALSHRDGARLIADAPPAPELRAQAAPNMARLEAAGFSTQDARYAFVALTRYALGSALAEQVAGRRSDRAFEYGLEALIVGLRP
jgi:TetR/AcrR family tetracycline transcriptional repressor